MSGKEPTNLKVCLVFLTHVILMTHIPENT